MKIRNGLFTQNNYNEVITFLKNQILENKLLILCIALFLISSFFFQSKFLYNWDAGQFALGTKNYSLSEHQPHPPGYFLFVLTGNFLNYGFDDINTSFVFLNILAGLFAIIFLYKALYLLSSNEVISFWGALFFIVNPVFWFYHSVALTYTFEALLTIMLSYLTYRQLLKRLPALPASAFLTTFIAGFRPSVLIIALPFLISQIVYSEKKSRDLWLGLLAGLAGSLVWFPVFVLKVGGIMPLYKFVISQLGVANATVVYNINHKLFILQSFVYALHLVLVFLLLFLKKTWFFIRKQRLFFLILAIIWQLIVYLFLHFGDVGYILSIVPLFYLLLIPTLQQMSLNKRRMGLVCVILVGFQFYVFVFGMNFINHHKIKQLTFLDIKTHDNRVYNFINFLDKYNPEETLVILLRGQYLASNGEVASYPYDDIRLLSYYLPDYKLYDLLGVKDIYFVAKNYTYSQKNQSDITVSSKIKDVIFLADYIHPEMRPVALRLNYLYDSPDTRNIYWGAFEQKEFEYNGMIFKKME